MFGNAAVSLLKIMGMSGNVPGAIMAEDLPDAIAKLESELNSLQSDSEAVEQDAPQEATQNAFDEQDNGAVIGLDKRAGPLISLLKAAASANENVLWDH
jgi:hypothetical protein